LIDCLTIYYSHTLHDPNTISNTEARLQDPHNNIHPNAKPLNSKYRIVNIFKDREIERYKEVHARTKLKLPQPISKRTVKLALNWFLFRNMKRSLAGEFKETPREDTNMKRSRVGNKFETRLLIPSKIAGSIIGKAGANIQCLRNEYNANVRVPDCPGPERVMTIQADDAQTCINVIAAALPYMSEEAARSLPGQKPDEQSGPKEIRLLIHQSIVGGIIGRAGFKIKEIREGSGANIKVNQTCAPQSSDRCVAVQGTNDKIIAALRLIIDVVENTEIKGFDQPYDPNNFDGYYAHEYGGYGSERDVMGFYDMPMGGGRRGNFRGRGNFGNPRGSYGGRGRGGFGDNRNAGNFGGGFEHNSRNSKPDDHSFGNNDAYAAGASNYDDDENGGGPTESTQVTIPKDMAGAIIGPGGSRIRKIRAESRATITIDEPVQGSDERIITISGNQRSIQTAQYLLQQSVRDHAGPAGAGIGNNFSGGF